MDTYLWVWSLTYLICPTTVFGTTTRKEKHQAINMADLSDKCIPECAIQLLDYNFIGTRVESDSQHGSVCICEGFRDVYITTKAFLVKTKGKTVFQPPEIAEPDSTVILKAPSAYLSSHDINITVEVMSNHPYNHGFNIEQICEVNITYFTNLTFGLLNGTVLHDNTFPASDGHGAKQTISISRDANSNMFVDGMKVTDDLERVCGSDFVVLSVQQNYDLGVLVHSLSFENFEERYK